MVKICWKEDGIGTCPPLSRRGIFHLSLTLRFRPSSVRFFFNRSLGRSHSALMRWLNSRPLAYSSPQFSAALSVNPSIQIHTCPCGVAQRRRLGAATLTGREAQVSPDSLLHGTPLPCPHVDHHAPERCFRYSVNSLVTCVFIFAYAFTRKRKNKCVLTPSFTALLSFLTQTWFTVFD